MRLKPVLKKEYIKVIKKKDEEIDKYAEEAEEEAYKQIVVTEFNLNAADKMMEGYEEAVGEIEEQFVTKAKNRSDLNRGFSYNVDKSKIGHVSQDVIDKSYSMMGSKEVKCFRCMNGWKCIKPNCKFRKAKTIRK